MRPRLPSDEVSTVARSLDAAASEVAVAYAITANGGAQVTVDGSGSGRVLVGSSPACALRLDDRLVSRRHLAIELAGARLRVTDLGSTNGTTVNGVAIERALVGPGDTIVVGETTLRVARLGAPVNVPTSMAMRFGSVVGASLQMRRLYPLFERLAAANVPAILEGETGTGKEVLAESLHREGPRANGPFVVFDAATIAPGLIEAALFGHEPTAVRGAFERASGGTLLLDEVGELDREIQAKLLRAIDRSEVQPVGSDRLVKVDVRVLASTRRDLDREIQEGRFRDDLFYRLAVARVELPPLRAREGDVALLARHFWKELGGGPTLPYKELTRFESYDWPGNVRELHNAVVRLLTLGESAAPPSERPGGAPAGDAIEAILALDLPLPRAKERVLSELERRYVERVLAAHEGSVVRAAAASGIALRYFQILRARHR